MFSAQQEIRKYMRRFGQQATKCGYGGNFHKDQNADERKKLVEVANTAIQPLMKYLHSNITILHEWLCEVGRSPILPRVVVLNDVLC